MSFLKNHIKAKKFLKSGINRNFGAFLFFLLLSTGFWLFLTLNEEYEVEIAVPVKLKNMPANVVITTPPPSEVKIKLRDLGGALLKYRHTKQLGTITIDFTDYDQRSGHVTLLSAEIAKNAIDRLQNSTKVIGLSPDTLEYFYNFGTFRKVPVRINASVSTDSISVVSDTLISPAYVKVYASNSILDTLSAVYTRPFVLSNLKQKETYTAQLATIRGAKIEPRQVVATFDIDQMTEKTIQVPIEHINFPANKTLKTFPSQVSVTFHVGMKHYKEFTADRFAIVVSYDEVSAAEDNRLKLSLKSKPEGANHIRIIPDVVEFLIEDSGEY